jgi:hypothetical protein
MKELQVIEVPADGRPDWYEGSFCMFFVYSRDNGNFIIKGYRREAERFLKKNYTHYFYYLSMWNHHESRGHWIFWKDNVSIFEPSRSKPFRRLKYSFVKYTDSSRNFTSQYVKEIEFTFKRIPKRWINDFNKF